MKIDEQVELNNKKIKTVTDENILMELMKLNNELQNERKAAMNYDELSAFNL